MSVDFRLYLVTDRNQTAGRSLVPVLEQAFEAGLRAVQLRERDLSTAALVALATEILTLARRYGARLLINDRIDVALAVAADGVHLRADSMPVSVARRLIGPERLIGVSTHSIEEIIDAEAAGADFAVIGPIFDTPSKRPYGLPLGVAPLAEAVRRCALPIFAIGGIGPEEAMTVRDVGAHGVAVVSSILTAPDVGRATCALLDVVRSL